MTHNHAPDGPDGIVDAWDAGLMSSTC
jgi:hypothetical protein